MTRSVRKSLSDSLAATEERELAAHRPVGGLAAEDPFAVYDPALAGPVRVSLCPYCRGEYYGLSCPKLECLADAIVAHLTRYERQREVIDAHVEVEWASARNCIRANRKECVCGTTYYHDGEVCGECHLMEEHK